MQGSNQAWHTETVSPQVQDTLKCLAGIKALQNFYLAGGTALALHIGHRRSVDLDFFNPQSFDEDAFLAGLHGIPGLSLISRSEQTVYLLISDVKTSFIGYEYPMLFPFEYFAGVAVADLRDIACMKFSALAGRGSRRDFIDLYAVAQRYGLPHILELFQRKFAQVNYSPVHLQKSLVYFADAEKEPMPDMLLPLTWGEVKAFFIGEVRKLRTS